MFTGIIEEIGKVSSIISKDDNKIFEIESKLAQEVEIDDSVAHNGVCLTVIEKNDKRYKVEAIKETLSLSSLDQWQAGLEINLERAMLMGSRLDGHIVQGHVDSTAQCVSIEDQSGSWMFAFEFDPKFGAYLIPKGSITVDGISLTVVNPSVNRFSVAIIPYTFQNTHLKNLKIGDIVNLEFDLFGKYFVRFQNLNQ